MTLTMGPVFPLESDALIERSVRSSRFSKSRCRARQLARPGSRCAASPPSGADVRPLVERPPTRLQFAGHQGTPSLVQGVGFLGKGGRFSSAVHRGGSAGCLIGGTDFGTAHCWRPMGAGNREHVHTRVPQRWRPAGSRCRHPSRRPGSRGLSYREGSQLKITFGRLARGGGCRRSIGYGPFIRRRGCH